MTESNASENISQYVDKSKSMCLNESSEHNVQRLLMNTTLKGEKPNSNYFVQSSTDEQIILNLPFTQQVHIRAIQIFAKDDDSCPKTIKFFTNKANGLDFDDVSSVTPVQEIEFTPSEIGKVIPLKFLKFRNVSNLIVFVESNHGASHTIIQSIQLYGNAISGMNVNEIKKTEGFAE